MAKDFSYVIRSFGGLADNYENSLPKEHQSPDMVNFMITEDYRLKKRPGFRTVKKFDGDIRAIRSGLFLNTRHYFLVEGERVWHSETGFDQMKQIGTLPGHDLVELVEFDGKLLFLSGEEIRVFDPETGFSPIEPYRPLLTVATSPEGVGTPLEDVNLLGGRARQTFSPDGKAYVFFLSFPSVDSVDYVLLNGVPANPDSYEADPRQGCVIFNGPLAAGNPDRLEIGFTKHDPVKEAQILRCRWGMSYGGDNDLCLFLWGNPDCPAVRFHSGSADGKPCLGYFPEIHYTRVGDGTPITDILRHYDRQVIFTKDCTYYSCPQSSTDQLGRVRTLYPVYLLSAAAGNLAPGNASFAENDPVTVTAEGLCRWMATNVREEKNARVFSGRIKKGLSATDLSKVLLYRRPSDGCIYLVTQEKDIYVYSPSLDVFWRYRGWKPTCFFEEEGGSFYFGTADGKLCAVEGRSDDGVGIDAHWSSTELSLGDEVHTKTLHRIGVKMAADEENRVELSWTADVEGKNLPNGRSRILKSDSSLFSFGELAFDRMSFNTAYHRRKLSVRAEARRFHRIRLKLCSQGTWDAQIENLTLTGTVNDKKV